MSNLALTTRTIVVKGTNHRILLVGKMGDTGSVNAYVTFKLYMNEVLLDKVKINIFKMPFYKYYKNDDWMLRGELEGGVRVGVKVRGGLLRRPEYMFYIADQVVYREKGSRGGI